MSDQRIQPPSDVTPSELWQKLQETPFPSDVFDFPRRGADGKPIGKVRIRVLQQEEHDRARIVAHEKLERRKIGAEQLKSVTLREVAADMVAKELLAVACLNEKSAGDDRNGQPMYGRVFVDGDDLGKLTADEVAVLFRAWQLVQRKWGPSPNQIDVDAWIKRLAEGGSGLPLAFLSLPDVVELASTLSEKVCSLLATLESQWSILPEPCRLSLAKFHLGTGFWSERLVASTDGADSFANSTELDIDDAGDLDRKLRLRQEMLDAVTSDE